MTTTKTFEKTRIVNGGMGSMLCPPYHPMHSYQLETDIIRRKENRGSMSLDYALECDYVSDGMKRRIKGMFDKWNENKPDINSPEVKKWRNECLGYFSNCYSKDGITRNVNDGLDIIKGNPFELKIIDRHLGVMMIRQYYPEYQPTYEDFVNAKWGS